MRTVFEIKDMRGETVAEHVRVDWPGGKKRLYWQIPGCDARDGLMGLSTPDLPLYGTERLSGLEIGETVLLTEGERSAEALWPLGLHAVATVTGASSTPGEDALAALLPYDVVTWEDYDQAGIEHMQRSAGGLIRLGGRARRLIWAGATQKGDDAADFVARGGSRLAVDLMVLAAEPWVLTAPTRREAPGPSYGDADGRVEQARSHLLDVVEARLGPPARRMGRSLFWVCPFHADRDPSFKVDLREPFFRCFGCDARGDVFEFLKRSEGVEFKDALRELAPPVGLGGIPRLWG